jgi:hypothetical protein
VQKVASEFFQYTDPTVSQTKFEEELNGYELLNEEWRKKGVFLVKKEFPLAEFLFTVPKLKPSSVAFAVRIDFTNYNAEPLSVKFINPFTRELVTRKDVMVKFTQVSFVAGPVAGAIPNVKQQDLLQGQPDDVPFFCIQGVREYHENPFHTGDAWELYRGEGIGTLNFLLDQLYNYSILQIVAHKVDLQPVISFQQQITIQQKI